MAPSRALASRSSNKSSPYARPTSRFHITSWLKSFWTSSTSDETETPTEDDAAAQDTSSHVKSPTTPSFNIHNGQAKPNNTRTSTSTPKPPGHLERTSTEPDVGPNRPPKAQRAVGWTDTPTVCYLNGTAVPLSEALPHLYQHMPPEEQAAALRTLQSQQPSQPGPPPPSNRNTKKPQQAQKPTTQRSQQQQQHTPFSFSTAPEYTYSLPGLAPPTGFDTPHGRVNVQPPSTPVFSFTFAAPPPASTSNQNLNTSKSTASLHAPTSSGSGSAPAQPKMLSSNPNGRYVYTPLGSSRVAGRNRRRPVAQPTDSSGPAPAVDGKRRRTGAEIGSGSGIGSAFPSTSTSSANGFSPSKPGNTTTNGVGSPTKSTFPSETSTQQGIMLAAPQARPATLTTSNIFPSGSGTGSGSGGNAAPATPIRRQSSPHAPRYSSPLRQVVLAAASPGSSSASDSSPPPIGPAPGPNAPGSVNGSTTTPSKTFNALKSLIDQTEPVKKEKAVQNPYENGALVVKGTKRARGRRTLEERRREEAAQREAKERKEKEERERAEKEREKEKLPAQAMIEATVPKGAVRSRPPPNIGKKPEAAQPVRRSTRIASPEAPDAPKTTTTSFSAFGAPPSTTGNTASSIFASAKPSTANPFATGPTSNGLSVASKPSNNKRASPTPLEADEDKDEDMPLDPTAKRHKGAFNTLGGSSSIKFGSKPLPDGPLIEELDEDDASSSMNGTYERPAEVLEPDSDKKDKEQPKDEKHAGIGAGGKKRYVSVSATVHKPSKLRYSIGPDEQEDEPIIEEDEDEDEIVEVEPLVKTKSAFDKPPSSSSSSSMKPVPAASGWNPAGSTLGGFFSAKKPAETPSIPTTIAAASTEKPSVTSTSEAKEKKSPRTLARDLAADGLPSYSFDDVKPGESSKTMLGTQAKGVDKSELPSFDFTGSTLSTSASSTASVSVKGKTPAGFGLGLGRPGSSNVAPAAPAPAPTSAAPKEFDWGAAGIKAPTSGNKWTCDSCMCSNDLGLTQCGVCEADKPGSAPKAKSPAPPPAAPIAAPVAAFNWSAAGVAAPKGGNKWTCDVCMVSNQPEADQCVACEAEKPGYSKSKTDVKAAGPPAVPTTFKGFGLGAPASTAAPAVAAAPAAGFNWAAAGLAIPKTGAAKWTCDTCMVSNEASASKCVACEADKPGAAKTETKTAPAGPPTVPTAFKGFSFGVSAPAASSAPAAGFNWGAAGLAAPKTSNAKWTCDTCMVSNDVSASQCIACEAYKPGAAKEAKAAAPVGPPAVPTGFKGFSFGASAPASTFTPAPTFAPTAGFNWAAAGAAAPKDEGK